MLFSELNDSKTKCFQNHIATSKHAQYTHYTQALMFAYIPNSEPYPTGIHQFR